MTASLADSTNAESSIAVSARGRWWRACALAAVFAGLCGSHAFAAADWEWSANQGWSMGAGAPQATPEAQMQYAYDLENAGNYMDASRQYFLLLKHWPHAPDAGIALQRLAKCLFQMENFYASYQAIHQVIQSYPNSGRFDDLVAIELKIGQRMLEHKATTIFGNPEDAQRDSARKAIEIFNAVIQARQFGPSAPEAYLGQGDAYFRLGEFAKARDAFDTALKNFPKMPEIAERARYGIMKIEAMQGRVPLEQVREQEDVVRTVMTDHAKREGIDTTDYDPIRQMDAASRELNEQEAQKLLTQAEVYGRIGSPKATRGSLFLYGEILRRFPDTSQADIAREKLGKTKVPREESQASKFLKGLNPKTWNFFGRDEPPEFVVASKPSPEDKTESAAGGPVVDPLLSDAGGGAVMGGPAHAPIAAVPAQPAPIAASPYPTHTDYPAPTPAPGLYTQPPPLAMPTVAESSAPSQAYPLSSAANLPPVPAYAPVASSNPAPTSTPVDLAIMPMPGSEPGYLTPVSTTTPTASARPALASSSSRSATPAFDLDMADLAFNVPGTTRPEALVAP